MLARCVATLKPPPELTLSQWADRYRMLSAESSAEPGRWHTDKAPYQREIMDAIGDAHIRRVVIMCAAQLGKTELLLNMNLPFDKAPKFVQNSVAAAPAASGFVNTPTPAEQPGNNSHKEDTNMANEIKTVDELRGAYPALVDQIEQAAALRATNAERQRIRDIEEMALPGSEQITNEAKYDKPMSASDYAKAAMKNAKEQGAAWLNTMQQGANASGVNSVGSAPAPTGGEKPDEFMDAIKGLGKKQ